MECFTVASINEKRSYGSDELIVIDDGTEQAEYRSDFE